MENSVRQDVKWVVLSAALVAVCAYLWKPEEWLSITILAGLGYSLMAFGPRFQSNRTPDDRR